MTATTGPGDTPRDDRETGAQDAPQGYTRGADEAAGGHPAEGAGSSPLADTESAAGREANQGPSATGEPYAESPSTPTPSFAAGPAPADRSEGGSDTVTTIGPAFPGGEGARHPSPYGPPPTGDRSGASGRWESPAGAAQEPTLHSGPYPSSGPSDQQSDSATTRVSPYPSSADITETARYPVITSSTPDPQGHSAQAYGSAHGSSAQGSPAQGSAGQGSPGQGSFGQGSAQGSGQGYESTQVYAQDDAPTRAIPGPADYAPSVPGHSPLVPAAAEPVVVPPPAGAVPPLTGTGRDVGGRAVAAVISSLLGALLVAGGLYLVGEFGSRMAAVMLETQATASVRDIILTLGGALLLLVAVVLNGWSPWATLLPGLALTGAGVWSVVSYDGADRVAGFVDLFFDSGQLINWGITAWILVIGVSLLGASVAAIIARAAGRTRGRP